MKRCFFIGHRDAEDAVFPCLVAEVHRHITQFGVKEFIVGGRGQFDQLAAKAVREAKHLYPEVKLTLLLAYLPTKTQPGQWDGFDETCYPPKLEQVPPRYAILKANRYLLEHCDYLIAYAWHPASNAKKLVTYAQKREKEGLITVTLLPRCT